MELIPGNIQAYAERFTSPESDLLKQVAADTYAHHKEAHMLSGHLQGRFLAMVSRLVAPQYILEVGTFTGYSALCLAEGLRADGQLHTIELREQEVNTARHYFEASAYSHQIVQHTGEAGSVIPSLPFTWDLVFIDADKPGYINYYELVLPRLRKGGLVIADNVLFHGQVLEEPVTGKSAKAIQAFNDHVLKDNRVDRVLLTLRDGVLLLQKNR
ncbi:O-methyltransferase [Flavihumibacter petaseus]|uniref:Putative O-methyltransferase n=1 Tax=Flavihumibacter petaseus NBRC 106054 TaxID=1220578 RepID=A0A0E9MU73_9BACT|nr:O-methyltransferase [Flavihumibacter petaseus]GAO41322.1 putative O-methyltransferase [Flavihumibacter petaseus NBRC 106054]